MYNSSLSLAKIINGVQRILGITSQIVPLYNKVKPTIQNASSIIKQLPIKKIITNPVSHNNAIPIKKEKKNINSPQFFL